VQLGVKKRLPSLLRSADIYQTPLNEIGYRFV
jgi:hypothetical protein